MERARLASPDSLVFTGLSSLLPSDWLALGTLQQVVLVIASTETREVQERWAFDIQTDKDVISTQCVLIFLERDGTTVNLFEKGPRAVSNSVLLERHQPPSPTPQQGLPGKARGSDHGRDPGHHPSDHGQHHLFAHPHRLLCAERLGLWEGV